MVHVSREVMLHPAKSSDECSRQVLAVRAARNSDLRRPMGPKHGDAPSVAYELLHGQLTQAQGLFRRHPTLAGMFPAHKG